jgi:hypothetical protein
MERSETIGQNCLGKLLLETGHSRVPEPPQSTTGTILFPYSIKAIQHLIVG